MKTFKESNIIYYVAEQSWFHFRIITKHILTLKFAVNDFSYDAERVSVPKFLRVYDVALTFCNVARVNNRAEDS